MKPHSSGKKAHWETDHKHRHHSLRTSQPCRTPECTVPWFLHFHLWLTEILRFISIQTKVVTFTPTEEQEDLGRRPWEVFMSEAEAGEHRSSLLVPYLFSGPVGLCLSCFSGLRDPVQGFVQGKSSFFPPAPTCTADPSYKKSFSHWFIYCEKWKSEDAWRSQVAGQARWQHLYMLNIFLASLFLMFISLLYEKI